ncbi:DUF3069 domain-containing protein [Vibrio sp. RC27]
MSQQETENQTTEVDLDTLSPELRQVIEFDEVSEDIIPMVASLHEISEEVVREAWDHLPGSAQNILDNFEQFHALISVSQGFAGVNVMQELAVNQPQDMDEDALNDYRAEILNKVLTNCVKDMVKQIKKARRDPILKRDFTEVFTRG